MYETLMDINQWWYELNEPLFPFYENYALPIILIVSAIMVIYTLILYWPILKDVIQKS